MSGAPKVDAMPSAADVAFEMPAPRPKRRTRLDRLSEILLEGVARAEEAKRRKGP